MLCHFLILCVDFCGLGGRARRAGDYVLVLLLFMLFWWLVGTDLCVFGSLFRLFGVF